MSTLLKTSHKKIKKPFAIVISTSIAIVFEVKNNGYTCKLHLNFFCYWPQFRICLLAETDSAYMYYFRFFLLFNSEEVVDEIFKGGLLASKTKHKSGAKIKPYDLVTLHQLNGVAKRVCYSHLWLCRLLQIIGVSSRWNQSRLKAWNWTVYVCHWLLFRVCFLIFYNAAFTLFITQHYLTTTELLGKGATWWPAIQGREILVTQRARWCYAWPRSPLNSQRESPWNGRAIAISSAIPLVSAKPVPLLKSNEGSGDCALSSSVRLSYLCYRKPPTAMTAAISEE